MIGAWFDDNWAEDVASWADLEDLLRSDWDRVEHRAVGLSLERADGLMAFDLRGQWHARHRRGLHRLGFRALSGSSIWVWDVEPPLRTTDLSLFASPLESIYGAFPTAAARVLQLRTTLARDHLVREQALRVLREAFRCQPDELGVLLVRQDDEWADDEDEDDAWPLPGG